MTSFTGVAVLSAICSFIVSGFAAPTTYDESQMGEVNVAGQLNNIFVFVALPSKLKPQLQVDNSEVASYLVSLLADRPHSGSAEYDANTDSHEPSKVDDSSHDEDDDISLFSDEEDSKDVVQHPQSSSGKINTDDKSSEARPKARNLWSHLEDVVDNKQGTSLKKELTWDDVLPAGDGHSRSNDHNEVGLIPDHHFKLLGGGPEDCGPDRERDSSGICQAQPAE